MRTVRKPSRFNRIVAASLSLLVGLGPVATPTYAALTALADEPLNVKNSSKPNIVMTIDDSTSMLNDFLPDDVIGIYCRDGMGSMNSICGSGGASGDFSLFGYGKDVTPGYIFQQYNRPYTSFATQDSTTPTPISFDVAGPGAGCDNSIPKCSPGIDTGASPGIPLYPSTALYSDQTNSNVNGGAPYSAYGYWKLWPAPVHNNALNHMYYNPMLTYEPPVHDDASSFDSMNAANTSNWTHVPVDPWASPVVYIDLTANVTVGQWCNSDWSVGHENDPAYCRTNGVGASAPDAATASSDGDYLYPWVPAGIQPFNNLGYQGDNINPTAGSNTIGMSIAYSKVNSGTKALLAAWTTAQDSKYFYENDNILWCNPSATKWPLGTGIAQSCFGATSTAQTCSATNTTPACTGGQTCGTNTNTCVSNAQTCKSVTNTQVCNPIVAGTCSSYTPACVGYVAPTCNPNPQTCNGFATNNCNAVTPTCNGYKAPGTCTITNKCNGTGSVCATTNDCPVLAGSCVPTYVPAGCNTCVGPECGTCTLTSVCSHQPCVTSGTCTNGGKACTGTPDCGATLGTCSVGGASCSSSATCPGGQCSLSPNGACSTKSDCADQNGKCSGTANPCQTANAATQCPNQPKCTNPTTKVCAVAGDCSATNGKCAVTNAACNPSTPCAPFNGCTAAGPLCPPTCPAVSGTCSTTLKACTKNSDCPNTGTCSIATTTVCTTATQATDCPAVKTCKIDGLSCATTACANNAVCSVDGKSCATTACAKTGVCDANSKNAGTACATAASCTSKVISGKCSIKTTVTCSTPGTDLAECPNVTVNGQCAVNSSLNPTTGDVCSVASPTCPNYFPPATTAVCSTMTHEATPKSLLADANGAGEVCRHNNQAYASDGTLAAPFNYPNSVYNTPVTAGTGANACTVTPRFKTVPRHYWKTNVEWCDHAVGSGTGDKWGGYGDNSTGSCVSFQDSTHIYPRFYQFGTGPADAAYTSNYTHPAFARTDLTTGNSYTHTYETVDWTNVSGATVTSTDTVNRTYAQEMENYANWFTYYRTRIQAVKTVMSLAFLGTDPTTAKFNVDDSFRVGLHSLSTVDGKKDSAATMFVPVDDFGATQKTAWATQLFGISVRMSQATPTLNAIARIGKYYQDGGSAVLNTTVDPIVLSCQKNWHMLFTDGLTDEINPTSLTPELPTFQPGDMDESVPSAAAWVTDAGLLPGQIWPPPYHQDATTPVSNSASDYATYFWVTDLRPSMTNNVGTSSADPADWQHINFAAISLGTQGKLAAGDQGAVEAQLTSGAIQWTVPYPLVEQPDASGVDDLWHASVNSRGRFVNADSADEIKLGLGAILADIANTAGSRAGASLQTINLTGTMANAYRVTFEPGWGGTLSKVNIDPATAVEIPPAPWQVGGGKNVTNPIDSLYAQLTPTIADPTPWYNARNIITVRDDTVSAVPFRFDQLSAAQQDTLAPGKPTQGKQVLEYLRGNQANEGTATSNFRVRVSLLGDIVDASPQFVGPASAPYQEFNDPGYTAFKALSVSRSSEVYAAANDGMLHAFDDSSGTERFAYIPRELFRDSEDAGLAALTLKEGALPPFVHHFYVDSTPVITDVDFGSKDWHSILVGGLGKGGHSYYALDVTAPDDITTENTAAAKWLWEFTDADMGYTYGKPLITKTAGWGGKWVVILPSGYNNASGLGKIFILDAKTGTLLKTMSTGFGSSTSPSGLAQISAFTQDYHNYLADEVYAGDQYGNVWRFDLRNTDPTAWTVGLLAQLTDPSGVVQPVTTQPDTEIDIANGADRWVFVGTGRLLDTSDLSNDQIQTFYALRDGTQKIPGALTSTTVPAITRTDLAVVTDGTGTGGITAKGWLNDLPLHSRIVTPYIGLLSTVVYSATKPQTDPCLTGQSADVFVRSFAEGVSQVDASDSSTGITCTSDFCTSDAGAVDAQIVGDTPTGEASPNLYVAITLGTTGKLAKIPFKPPKIDFSHRLSWRILSE